MTRLLPLFLLLACTAKDEESANDTAEPSGTDTDVSPTDPTDTETSTTTDTDTSTETDTETTSANCSPWMAFEPGRIWTYKTTNSDGPFEFTQVLMINGDGLIELHSELPDAESVFTYQCSELGVELLKTVSMAGPITATETYDPPFLVWTAAEPTDGLSWSSASTVTVTLGPGNGIEQQKTGTWTIVEANVEAVTDEGTVWPDSVVFEHQSTTTQNGNLISETDQLGITSLQGPGIVWQDVLTTTPGGTAESFTELVSSEVP